MKFWEAMKALEEGKKIRAKHWDEYSYLVLQNKKFLIFCKELSGGRKMDTTKIYAFEWEIYEEPKPKKQVWQWRFRDGVRQCWTVDHELRTEQEALDTYRVDAEKHAGPFDVEE